MLYRWEVFGRAVNKKCLVRETCFVLRRRQIDVKYGKWMMMMMMMTMVTMTTVMMMITTTIIKQHSRQDKYPFFIKYI